MQDTILEPAAEGVVITAPTLIAGDWVEGGTSLDRVGPYLRRVVTTARVAGPGGIQAVATFASAAAKRMARIAPAARAEILDNAARLATQRRAELLAHKLGTSFAAGNTTLVKAPAGVVAVLLEAGAPPEAVQLLHGGEAGSARHERAASHTADGYARVTATLDSVPLVAIAGNVPSYMYGRHSHQEICAAGRRATRGTRRGTEHRHPQPSAGSPRRPHDLRADADPWTLEHQRHLPRHLRVRARRTLMTHPSGPPPCVGGIR